MTEDMQYPITPYLFEINTRFGIVAIEIGGTEYDLPAKTELRTVEGDGDGPVGELRNYFEEYGFGMRGHIIDIDYASPQDIHHVLSLSQHYHAGKQEYIKGFAVVRGFVPYEGYEELFPDPDDEDGPVLESATIDKEAHKAASSPQNNLPEPTEAQKEAGNYRKGHVTISGLDIAIENPAGSERSGVDRDGKKWTSKLNHHYGYIKGTVGRDKDHLDVFLGPDPEGADKVFIVNQANPETGAFDEHKIMLGFSDEDEARAAYLSNYTEGWQGLGSICTLFMDEFKDWLRNGDTTISVERGTVGSYRQDPSWVGVDLDGTLARYDGWAGEDHIGEPVPLMMAFVKHLIEEGRKVKIFTARASDPEKIRPVKKWLEKHGLGALEVTNAKDHHMTMLYDDRAAKVIANTGVIIETAREGAIMERGPATDYRAAIQDTRSFNDIESVFANVFGPIVVRKFIFGEISDLENQIKAMREKLAQVSMGDDGTGIVRGEKTTAYLNDNTPIELQYAVIEADRLITSHTDEMSLNQEFSQDLQPRDRARMGMKLQVDEMAGKLNPERLGESSSVSTGAPIIGEDLTVESGNGRTIAIRKAYAMGDKGQEYKQWLMDNAGQFGISEKIVESMESPILARIRITEIDRSEFARKANEDEIAQMAPSELARADAAKLTDDDVALFQPSEDGNIAAATNRTFITRFFEKLGSNAATGYMTRDGAYTKQLVDRVQAAIFQKAYQDDNLLALMAEEADPKIKNILGAMTIAAGEFSRAKAIDQGLMGIDIPRHVIEAAKLIKKSREDNQAIEEVLAQGGLFEEISEDTKRITLFIDKNIRSAKRMGEVFKESARLLRKIIIDEKAPKLLDTGEPLPTAAQIVARAIEKEREGREGGRLFEAATRNQDNFIEDNAGLVNFSVGTVARDNQSDETFVIDRDVLAERESAAAYRIRGLTQGPNSYDSHWIYRRDNKELFEKMAKTEAPFDWKGAIGAATSYEDIDAVFKELFPILQTTLPKAERPKKPWEMTRDEYIAGNRQLTPAIKIIGGARNGEILFDSKAQIHGQIPGAETAAETAIDLDLGFIDKSGRYITKEIANTDASRVRKELFETHANNVKQALSEGKPVPPEVLAGYPDIIEQIKNDLLEYIRNFPDFVFESGLGEKSREQIRTFLEGIKPENIKALKLGSHEAYLEVLKELVAKLFPEGAEYTFRKTEDGSETDYEHFLKDRLREDYIQTTGDTMGRSDIVIELREDGKDKEFFIKKYFDDEIKKDIWDMVIVHDKEIRTKFPRKGKDGQRYIEGQILKGWPDHEASRSGTPEGDSGNAPTLLGNTDEIIPPSSENVKQEEAPTIVDFDSVWKLPKDTAVQIEYQGKPWRKALLSNMEAGVIYYENLRGGGWQKSPIAPQHFRQFLDMLKGDSSGWAKNNYKITVINKGGSK